MLVSESRRKIGILSHGGTQNLGDEALFAAVIQNAKLRIPEAEIVGFTINPEDTRERHGIACFPIRCTGDDSAARRSRALQATNSVLLTTHKSSAGLGSKLKKAIKSLPGMPSLFFAWRRFLVIVRAVLAEPKFLLESYHRLKGVELLLVAGSQQLNDIYGAWGFPFTLFKWTTLAKYTGTKVAVLSVGAGPIDAPLSKFFIRRVLNQVSYRSYRDAISRDLVRSLGVKGEHPVFPDLVYSLQLPAPKPYSGCDSRVVVGTNPVPFYDGRYWRTSDPVRYQEYVQKLACFSEWLDGRGHGILFFPTQVRADARTIDDIGQALNGSRNSSNFLPRQTVQTIEDLVSEISRVDLVVANRYHGILISLMMNKPVLGIAYHEKSRALLAQVGQADYVLNVSDFKLEQLIERFSAMESNASAIKKQIADSMAPLRTALAKQYDTVFSLISVKPVVKNATACAL